MDKFSKDIESLVRGSAVQFARTRGLSGDTDFDEDSLLEFTLNQWDAGNFYPVSEQYMLDAMGGNQMGGFFSKIFKRVSRVVKRVSKVVEKTAKVAIPLGIAGAATFFGGPAAGAAAVSALGMFNKSTRGASVPNDITNPNFDAYKKTQAGGSPGTAPGPVPGYTPTFQKINPWTGRPFGSPQDVAVMQQRKMSVSNVDMAQLERMAVDKANAYLSERGIRFNSPAGQDVLRAKVKRDVQSMFGVSGLTAGKLALFIGIPAAIVALMSLMKKVGR